MFRIAKPSDAKALTDLIIRSKSHWGYSRKQIRAWTPHLTLTPEFISRNPVVSYMLRGTIAAVYALVKRSDEEMELEHCWVDPAHIGEGIGRNLIEHVKKQMILEHITKLRIVSDPNAAGFYERMGAVQQGEYLSPESGRHLPLFYLDIAPSQTKDPTCS